MLPAILGYVYKALDPSRREYGISYRAVCTALKSAGSVVTAPGTPTTRDTPDPIDGSNSWKERKESMASLDVEFGRWFVAVAAGIQNMEFTSTDLRFLTRPAYFDPTRTSDRHTPSNLRYAWPITGRRVERRSNHRLLEGQTDSYKLSVDERGGISATEAIMATDLHETINRLAMHVSLHL